MKLVDLQYSRPMMAMTPQEVLERMSSLMKGGPTAPFEISISRSIAANDKGSPPTYYQVFTIIEKYALPDAGEDGRVGFSTMEQRVAVAFSDMPRE